MTQNEELIKHFNGGNAVTAITAAQYFFITQLSSRIGELEASGYPISKTRIKYTSPLTGKTKSIVEYRKA